MAKQVSGAGYLYPEPPFYMERLPSGEVVVTRAGDQPRTFENEDCANAYVGATVEWEADISRTMF